MAKYMAFRIITGALEYNEVILKRPDLKDGIDEELKSQGREDLIVTPETLPL